MSLRLVVFDMDGTLIDSQDVIVDAMRRAFASEARAAPSAEEIRRIVGLELSEAVGRLAPEEAPETIHRIGEAYKAAFVAARAAGGGEGGAPMYPGARAALERLAATDALLGIATGKARRGLDHTLAAQDIGRFFVTTQTCSEAPGKPHPGMLENCLSETGALAADSVMVGDTTFDMEMARNAGFRALGVAWGYHEADELRAAGAEIILQRFDEIDAALAEIFGLGWAAPSG